jgi:hypothetical protein
MPAKSADIWLSGQHVANILPTFPAKTVWKCQGGTFDYIIALLEHSPGSPTLTFEKLYVMLTRVKMACKFQCLPLSPVFNKAKLYNLHPKILATK